MFSGLMSRNASTVSSEYTTLAGPRPATMSQNTHRAAPAFAAMRALCRTRGLWGHRRLTPEMAWAKDAPFSANTGAVIDAG